MVVMMMVVMGRGGRRACARDAVLLWLWFIDGEEEDVWVVCDGVDVDDCDVWEEKKNEVGCGEEEGEEMGVSGEREVMGGGGWD